VEEYGPQRPSAAKPQPKAGISCAKTQRRKDKKKDSGLGVLATWREQILVFMRFHELAPFGEFAQTAQTFKYSNTEFAEIGVFLIKNSLLCALGASAVNHPSSSCASW
jgi:hypothetical protein